MKYSTKSKTALEACIDLEFSFCGFIEAAKRNGVVYINFTLGKPHEIQSLARAVLKSSKYRLAPGFIKLLKREGWL